MKTVKRIVLAATFLAAAFGMSACTDESSRHTLTVVSVNDGGVYFSDLLTDSGQVVADAVPVLFGNIPNGGGDPLGPGEPFSVIVVTGYTVTFDNGVYPSFSGGLTVRVPSGGTAEAGIGLSNLATKASIPLNTVSSTTARITFTGYNETYGVANGEGVTAYANLTVQVANFKDEDVPGQ
jgi:hypothetical protein